MWVSSGNSQETAEDTDLGYMPATPSICIKGLSLFMSAEFTVCIDGIALTTTCNRAVASKLMFLLYFELNAEYPPEVALTMEFVQRAIAGINPDKSSKARKTSRKQHSLSPKVAALANARDGRLGTSRPPLHSFASRPKDIIKRLQVKVSKYPKTIARLRKQEENMPPSASEGLGIILSHVTDESAHTKMMAVVCQNDTWNYTRHYVIDLYKNAITE
ncbi:uncharacterized protein LOC121047935 [Ixodes scapularis]|uniref:uncharacterized protein LOC121047935 n=1 Tax=Ixodes scapularis TaxID=6945 RepID=UPI001C380A7E|nr:uncharacterized protein LOC121047935 [Ixodes scapularis]